MKYALQEEPEQGHRASVLGLGALLAAGLWGGGLFAATHYEPPARPRRAPAVMQFVKIEPAPAPKSEPPAVETPRPEVPPPPDPKPAPKPKRPEKPKPAPPAAPEPPRPEPAAAAPVVLGLTLNSTSTHGLGPAVQIGNAFGSSGDRALRPETRPAPSVTPLQAAPPAVRVDAKVLRKFSPRYTEAALRAGVTGSVVMLVTIEPDGGVSNPRVVKGLGMGLDEVATDAVRQWTFQPATLDGVPIRSTRRITMEFVLEG